MQVRGVGVWGGATMHVGPNTLSGWLALHAHLPGAPPGCLTLHVHSLGPPPPSVPVCAEPGLPEADGAHGEQPTQQCL